MFAEVERVRWTVDFEYTVSRVQRVNRVEIVFLNDHHRRDMLCGFERI